MRVLFYIAFLIILGIHQQVQAQGVFIWNDVTDKKLTVWAENQLPCTAYLTAKFNSLDKSSAQLLPKNSKKKLLQLSIDSLYSPSEFKSQVQYNLTLGNPNAIHDSSYKYLLPYPQQKSYKLIQGNNSTFSHKTSNSRFAFDFKMPENSLVSAARGGTVGFVNVNNKKGGDDIKLMQQANKIVVCHDDGSIAAYAHLRHNGSLVSIGEQVYAGQIIGFSGNTGFSTIPHLHFVVLTGSQSVPIKFWGLPDTLKSGTFYQRNTSYTLR